MPIEQIAPTARSFVRSLNVLLKYSRLYGLEHARSAAQFDATWTELQQALRTAGDTGLLLGTSGSQLLLDGEPLESTHAERSFADLLNTSGVASICFNPKVHRGEFAKLVSVFMDTGSKAASLSDRLEQHFGKNNLSGIRVNEIRFVAEDSAFGEARVAAQLTAKTLGADAGHIQDWFRDPAKLIQLIAVAEGAREGTGGGHAGGDGHAGGTASGAASPAPLEEADMQGILHLLAQFGEAAQEKTVSQLDPAAWQQRVGILPQNAQVTLRQALAAVASKTPSAQMDESMLLRVAEDLAIRFALDRFRRGEVRVNAVRQLLDRMGSELDTLRKLLKSREEKMAGAGMAVESHADVLDRQFWAAVPDSGKRAVLTSSEAWCIPPRNVQQYVEELLGRGESDAAADILLRYAACVRNRDAEARKKAAIGLGQLAELYSRAASQRLQEAIRQIGQQMAAEQDAELKTLLGAAFVRLSQESALRRYYRPMQQALDSLADLEETREAWAQSLRPRTGIESRIPEFVEEALTAEALPDGLQGVLMRLPQSAGEQLAVRLARSARRSERENIVELAKAVGGPCVIHLRQLLKTEPPPKAVAVVGLLSRLDPTALEDLLLPRLREDGLAFQDAAVRQLSIAGAPERGPLLMNILELFDNRVMPLALDEIGMCGDPETAPKLVRLAEGEILPEAPGYLRVKAIEALGRMHAPDAAEHLRRFVAARKAFSWAYPEEIRTAAAQALMKLDPQWIEAFLPRAGLDAQAMSISPLEPLPDRDIVRHRRYRRIHLSRNVPAVLTWARGKYSSAISVLSLEGGLLSGDIPLAVGTEATLKIPAGFRSINMRTVVRFVRSHQAGFETVGMELQDRVKLRRLLASLGEPPALGARSSLSSPGD